MDCHLQVEGSALSQPVWPVFVDQGIPALERSIGCFIFDPPMGLQKAGEGASDDPWGLDNALRAINLVFSSCPAPFTIAMFSLWDLATMQTALANDKDLKKAGLEVSQFIMVKVSDNMTSLNLRCNKHCSKTCHYYYITISMQPESCGYSCYFTT